MSVYRGDSDILSSTAFAPVNWLNGPNRRTCMCGLHVRNKREPDLTWVEIKHRPLQRVSTSVCRYCCLIHCHRFKLCSQHKL